jgi:hypothetical protein
LAIGAQQFRSIHGICLALLKRFLSVLDMIRAVYMAKAKETLREIALETKTRHIREFQCSRNVLQPSIPLLPQPSPPA